jgi:pimeloyl-ACP methyl ester carboxylesterase
MHRYITLTFTFLHLRYGKSCNMMRMTTNHHHHHHHHHHRYPVRGSCSSSSSSTSLLLLLFLLTVFPHLLLLCARSYSITSATWTWRGRYPIAYERATRSIIVQEDDDAISTKTETTTTETTTTIQATTTTTTTTPVLLLNGFGVGSFHQHRLIHELLGRKQIDNSIDSNDDNNIVVYCIDYLGQGSSWPLDCNDGQGDHEVGLRYCGNTWVDQIVDFIREVIFLQEHHDSNQKKKVLHIVGNSVGGHLAAYVAAKLQSQDFIASSLCLLNPTPFWGLNLPGWDGTLPAPIIPKLIGRFLFDQIRDLHNIKLFLQAVYANGEEDLAAFDDTLVQQIRACTNGPGGHAAFASILWSPPVSITVPTSPSSSSPSLSNSNDDNKEDKEKVTINNFYDCLAFLANNNNSAKDDDGNKNSNSHSYSIPILLVFGQSDPWCKPALAQRMLQQAKCARYMEMTNVGHCPNHEAPIATAHILNAWWKRQQQQQQQQEHSKTSRNNLEPQWLPQHGATGVITIQESWGTTRLQEKSRDEIPLNLVDRLTTAFV